MPIARWSLVSKVPSIARSSHGITASPAGLLVLYGGEVQPRTPIDRAGVLHTFKLKDALDKGTHSDAIDKGIHQWTAVEGNTSGGSKLPEPRVGATVEWDEETQSAYVWGGRGGVDMAPLEGEQTGVWKVLLDGLHNTTSWVRVIAANEPDAPAPRSYHSSAIYDGRVYIHAGCPTAGRLNTLHSFDIATRRWKTLSAAPDPPRGGTSLAVIRLNEDERPVILRFAGFAGYELGADGSIDLYDISSDTWRTIVPSEDPEHGHPGARSVYGLVPFTSAKPALIDAVALLCHGEREASSSGHAGAGEFWDDVWILQHVAGQFSWKKVNIAESGPQGRGWFPSASYVHNGETKVVMFGGLLSGNARSDELWLLEVE